MNLSLLLRSALFYVVFFSYTIFLLPTLFLGLYIVREQQMTRYITLHWAYITLWFLKKINKLSYSIHGLEKIRASREPMIIASKHQSMWETVAFFLEFGEDTYFIYKKEYGKWPIFGRLLNGLGMIGVDRKLPLHALRHMVKSIQDIQSKNPNARFVIFPEGTRTKPGERGSYMEGIYLLYKKFNLPVMTVAVNSGVYWPRRGFLKHAGCVEAQIISMIQPGLERKEFLDQMINQIEDSSQVLFENSKIMASK